MCLTEKESTQGRRTLNQTGAATGTQNSISISLWFWGTRMKVSTSLTLFGIAISTVALVGYALVLARREDRESKRRTKPYRLQRPVLLTVVEPDRDAHLGCVGTE